MDHNGPPAVANAMKMFRGVETSLIHIKADLMLRIQYNKQLTEDLHN